MELKEPLFGVPLDVILRRSNEREVPSFVTDLIYFLCPFVSLSDLFIRGVPRSLEDEIIKALNQRTSRFCYKADGPYAGAALLMRFIKEIPNGLIPTPFVPPFLESFGQLDALKPWVKRLPPANYSLLRALCLYLLAVSLSATINNLTIEVLAAIWAPLLVAIPRHLTESDHLKLLAVTECLISESKIIFAVRFLRCRSSFAHFKENSHPNQTLVNQTPLNELTVSKHQNYALIDAHIHSITLLSTKLSQLKERMEALLASEDLSHVVNQVSDCRSELVAVIRQIQTYQPLFHTPTIVDATTLIESGRRSSMEDRVIHFDNLNTVAPLLSPSVNRSMYGVFDGHAGDEIAILAEKYLHDYIVRYLASRQHAHNPIRCLELGVKAVDLFICSKANEEDIKSGSTMVLVYIEGTMLYLANLGDSEAVMACRHPTPGKFEAMLLSHKHKPEDEAEVARMVSGGALVARGRVFGKLAVSRALGDSDFKTPKASANHVSNDPFLRSLQLDASHSFIIMACDGLWDVLTYQNAVDLIAHDFQARISPEKAAQKLATAAYDAGSQDNISVIVVYLYWQEQQ